MFLGAAPAHYMSTCVAPPLHLFSPPPAGLPPPALPLTAASPLKPAQPPLPRLIWAYWHAGALPEVAKACMASWRRHAPEWEVRLLKASEAAEAPAQSVKRAREKPQTFATYNVEDGSPLLSRLSWLSALSASLASCSSFILWSLAAARSAASSSRLRFDSAAALSIAPVASSSPALVL